MNGKLVGTLKPAMGVNDLEMEMFIVTLDPHNVLSDAEVMLYDAYVDEWNSLGVESIPKYENLQFMFYDERIGRAVVVFKACKDNKFDLSAIEEAYQKFMFLYKLNGGDTRKG